MIDQLIQNFPLVELHNTNIPEAAMCYVVSQGQDILAVGSSGSSQRLRALRGGSGKHNKKPIVSLCHKLRPEEAIRFFYLTAPSKGEAQNIEREVQAFLGYKTSINGELEYEPALRYLLSKINQELVLSERHQDLIELICLDGDIFGHAMRSNRLKSVTIEIFGDYYVRQLPNPRSENLVRFPQAELNGEVDSNHICNKTCAKVQLVRDRLQAGIPREALSEMLDLSNTRIGELAGNFNRAPYTGEPRMICPNQPYLPPARRRA